jgi:predicted Zn-dependent protease
MSNVDGVDQRSTFDGVDQRGIVDGVDQRDSEITAQVIDLVRSASRSAEAEVVVFTTERALTRFANSSIHQNVAESTTSVRLRLHTDGRTATGATTVTGSDGLRNLVDRTLAAARLSPPDALWPGLAPPAAVAPTAVDEETANADPSARARRVAEFVAAARGLETAGYCGTLREQGWFANSAGQTASAQIAQAAMDAIARAGTSDGVARLATAHLRDLDGAILGERAAAKARASLDPIELPPGRYEVVLEPTAVMDLVEFIAAYGFNAKAVAEQRSFVELDQAQFDPAVTLVDDPDDDGLTFDVEGTPKRRVRLVEAGVSRTLTHDRRTAAQAGVESTGHALPGGGSWGAMATNLHLLPALGMATVNGGGQLSEVDGPAADAAVADLVAKVGRGMLVTDNWYTRVLDPRTLVVTGLTRNGVWLIEDGKITRPVQNMRFTQSYPQALAPGAVLGVGAQSVALPSGWDVTICRAPALHLASWNYTGNASG